MADFQYTPNSVSADNRVFMKSILGGTRMADYLPVSQTKAAGAKVTISSDWDADPLSPFAKMKGLMSAITVVADPSLNTPAQETDRLEVLKLMTINPAYALGMESKLGTLEAGKYADFVVIDTDILNGATTPTQIEATKVLKTYMDGVQRYSAP